MPIGSRQSQTTFNSTPGSTRQSQSFGLDGAGNAGSDKGTTISFTAPNSISDSANGLGSFKSNDLVVVVGSAANSRTWTITAASAGSLTVWPTGISTEAAGQKITLIRD